MILNGYAILATFVGLVELCVGIAVVCLASAGLRRRAATGPALDTVAPRDAILLLLAFALVGASVASWPILYLLLASYIPEWFGVMCIQGVVRVGTGSEGAAGWLPTLVHALEFTKPSLVLAAGAWLTLHVADRRTRTSPLAGRVLGALLVVGLLATLDAAAQLAYVGIPKKERFLAAGCCVVPQDFADRTGSLGAADDTSAPAPRGRTTLVVSFYALSGVLVVGARWSATRDDRAAATAATAAAGTRAGWSSAALTVIALAALPITALFVAQVAAPVFLDRPDHRCAYCLLTSSPLAVTAMATYVAAAFATGWADVADRFGTTGETGAFISAQRRRLLRFASIGYLTALVILTGKLLAA